MEPKQRMNNDVKVQGTRSGIRKFLHDNFHDAKIVKTPSYNTVFNPRTGYFMRWGETFDDDPQYSPIGPELADIEISTICSKGCKWCYKGNTPNGKVMTLDEFKMIFHKLPKSVLQIAFGIGDINANPDMLDIFWYTRDAGVIPNVTISGNISDEWAFKLAEVCGAVAVSHYDDDECYDAVKKLVDAGLKQVNIHQLLSMQTFTDCMKVLDDAKHDNRLKDLHAVVFLSLKQTGRGANLHPVTNEQFEALVYRAEELEVKFGFDSCTACKLLALTGDKYKATIEPCESGLFSIYIDVEGVAWPCSFFPSSQKIGPRGMDIITTEDFLSDIWFSIGMKHWRHNLISGGRKCPLYEI